LAQIVFNQFRKSYKEQNRANKACRRTVCHVPFKGVFSLENIIPFRRLVLVATRPLMQTVGRWRTQNKLTKDDPLHS
jgi:hypothetical protein